MFLVKALKGYGVMVAALFALCIISVAIGANHDVGLSLATVGLAAAPVIPMRRRRRRDLSRGTYSEYGEKLDYSYYDSFLMLNTTLQQRMFQAGLGQGSTPKRQDQTNMTIGAQLPRGQRFTIKNIKFFYISQAAYATATVQKLYTMLTTSTFEFFITGKDALLSLTLQELLGASTLIAETPTVSGDNIPIIMPRYHGIFPLNIPLILAEQTNFEVRITHQLAPDAALNNDIVKISLNGKLERKS